MLKKRKMSVKIGDIVIVLSGSHKNETGEINKINRKTGKILLKGINLKFKHVKPKTKNKIGEIRQLEAPIHHSNVKLNFKKTSQYAKSTFFRGNR